LHCSYATLPVLRLSLAFSNVCLLDVCVCVCVCVFVCVFSTTFISTRLLLVFCLPSFCFAAVANALSLLLQLQFLLHATSTDYMCNSPPLSLSLSFAFSLSLSLFVGCYLPDSCVVYARIEHTLNQRAAHTIFAFVINFKWIFSFDTRYLSRQGYIEFITDWKRYDKT